MRNPPQGVARYRRRHITHTTGLSGYRETKHDGLVGHSLRPPAIGKVLLRGPIPQALPHLEHAP